MFQPEVFIDKSKDGLIQIIAISDLTDDIKQEIDKVKKLIFNSELKDLILKQCLNGTLHSSPENTDDNFQRIEITNLMEHGLSNIYFDAKDLKDLRLANLTKLSVVSILIMKNHLESLRWVLEIT